MISTAIDSGFKSAKCPTNGKPGYPVHVNTLKGLLASSLIGLRPTSYRFCPDPDCTTVYYSDDGLQVYDESTLKEKVYQKHPDDKDVLVCYCFGYTLRHITSEITENRPSSIPAVIIKGVRDGKCACNIRNPQGRCCLGNVKSLIERTPSLKLFK